MSERISKERKVKSYRWYKDSKMLGTFILLLSVTMQIFAWIPMPALTTVHGYTVGMVFGNFNSFFYFYMAYLGASMMLDDKISFPAWIKGTRLSYWFVALSTIFITVSFGFYQIKTEGGATAWGGEAFQSFGEWFETFTSKGNWIYPVDTTGGLIGAAMYAIFAGLFSGIGAIFIAVILLVISVSVLVTGTGWGLYKDFTRKKAGLDAAKLEKENTHTFEIEALAEDENFGKIKDVTISTSKTEEVVIPNYKIEDPFEDPFGDSNE